MVAEKPVGTIAEKQANPHHLPWLRSVAYRPKIPNLHQRCLSHLMSNNSAFFRLKSLTWRDGLIHSRAQASVDLSGVPFMRS